jgi:hypothetical protein
MSYLEEAGDQYVPLRSSLRGQQWAAQQGALGKTFYYRGYADQTHANCSESCFSDVVSLLTTGVLPPAARARDVRHNIEVGNAAINSKQPDGEGRSSASSVSDEEQRWYAAAAAAAVGLASPPFL